MSDMTSAEHSLAMLTDTTCPFLHFTLGFTSTDLSKSSVAIPLDAMSKFIHRLSGTLLAEGHFVTPTSVKVSKCQTIRSDTYIGDTGLIEVHVPLSVEDPFELDYLASLPKIREDEHHFVSAVKSLFGEYVGVGIRLRGERDTQCVVFDETPRSSLCRIALTMWKILIWARSCKVDFMFKQQMPGQMIYLTFKVLPPNYLSQAFQFITKTIRFNAANGVRIVNFDGMSSSIDVEFDRSDVLFPYLHKTFCQDFFLSRI